MAENVKHQSLHITIPLTPPSANHYVKHTGSGVHYKTKAAIAFQDAVAIFVRGQSVAAEFFSVTIAVFLGKGERLDCDNAAKVAIDALQSAGVFQAIKPAGKRLSDAAVRVLKVRMHRDAESPRTIITVEPDDEQ